MPIGAIGGALTGVSAIAGLFGKKQKTVTAPGYTPQQQALQSQIGATLQDRLANPANLDPLKTAAASNVNKGFDDASTNLESRLAARGFGNSGKLVTNEKSLAVGRAGALGSLESQFAGLQLDQNNKTLDDAQRFAFSGPGSTSTTTGGGGVAGAVSGGAETASLLYALNHFMSGGGGGGGSDLGSAGVDGQPGVDFGSNE